MIPYIQSLGDQLERSWRARSYDEGVFPALALDLLQREPPVGRLKVAEIVDWTFRPAHEFDQPGDTRLFGEPPVTLFQAPRFYIEALFWYSGTTAIHEHSFSGVFAVLAGSSVHSHWRFTPGRCINSRMICGRLERVSTEILRCGDMRAIDSGDRLIHQLFHLDQPSVTIVVRTYTERNRLPQYTYLPPGLKIDPNDGHDSLRSRRLLFLDAMARGRLDGLRGYAARIVEGDDLEAIFFMLSMLSRHRLEDGLLDGIFRAARERHGEVVDLFRQVCDGERRARRVLGLRARVVDPQPRFLLALLLLMPDREAIFEAIHLQYPDAEPLAMIEALLAEMSGKETIGFDFNEINRVIFRGLVEGDDSAGIFRRLRAEFHEDAVPVDHDQLCAYARQMASLDLFHPLLSESALEPAQVA
jgi:hypothetical protein